ncbi:acetoacetyl-CoA reductase [Thioalkalivibrio sp. HK1]|uniref:acetoacetyl-CoA reductase n=1 Tax=Thioalkalivibrio sp. HK1 TaxID=1469245 RepID=UPI000472FBEC|nr:acetoacetyl-CoA reductase [Thioalkalivibrio sp. HK1]
MSGRIALVTGGLGQLGRSICERLSQRNFKVVALDLPQAVGSDEAKDWSARQAHADGGEVALIEVDVTDYESCSRGVSKVQDEIGPVDVLVNCAGITRDATLKKLEKDAWDAVLTTNLDGVYNMTRQVIDGMTVRGFGRIVNISSVNGVKGQFGQTNYSAAKAGMHGFTMALAQEVARKGVTVNTVSPGYMSTKLVEKIPANILEEIVDRIPVGRLGETFEIAALVAFLCSDEAAFITGANHDINGGLHMR